jgi:hypothetical protein
MQFKKKEKYVPCMEKEKQKDVGTLVVSDREKEETHRQQDYSRNPSSLSLAFRARMKWEVWLLRQQVASQKELIATMKQRNA